MSWEKCPAIIEIDAHKMSLLCTPRPPLTRLDSAMFMFSLSLEGFKQAPLKPDRATRHCLRFITQLFIAPVLKNFRVHVNWFKCCRFSFTILSRNWLPTIGGFSIFLDQLFIIIGQLMGWTDEAKLADYRCFYAIFLSVCVRAWILRNTSRSDRKKVEAKFPRVHISHRLI